MSLLLIPSIQDAEICHKTDNFDPADHTTAIEEPDSPNDSNSGDEHIAGVEQGNITTGVSNEEEHNGTQSTGVSNEGDKGTQCTGVSNEEEVHPQSTGVSNEEEVHPHRPKLRSLMRPTPLMMPHPALRNKFLPLKLRWMRHMALTFVRA
eukprot:282438-Ditylum_brightwellii.AAC.1